MYGSERVPVQLVGLQVFPSAGVAALDGEILTAVLKRDRQAGMLRTELLRVAGDSLVSSTLIDGHWWLLDFDPRAGVLLGTYEGLPHFIILPPGGPGS